MNRKINHGENFVTQEGVVVGLQYGEEAGQTDIGDDAVIRYGTIIYADVKIGDGFTTGHNVLVREKTDLGDNVLVGTNTVIDGCTTIGSDVSFQTGSYIPKNTTIENNVFIGPHAVLTNDPYPIRQNSELKGPTLENHVSIGANATILPEVTVHEGSFVAAGAVVTENVPPNSLAMGVPAQHYRLPSNLQGENSIV